MVSGSYGQWQSVVSVYVVWQCWSVVVSISWGSVGQWQWVYVVWSVAVLVSDQWQWSVAVSVSGEWHCRSVVRGSVGQWSVAGRQSVVSGSAGQCVSGRMSVSGRWQCWSVTVSVSGQLQCRSVVSGSVGQWSVAVSNQWLVAVTVSGSQWSVYM